MLAVAGIAAARGSGNAGDAERSVDSAATSTATTTLIGATSERRMVPALDDQIDWLLDQFNGGTLTEADVVERFNGEFLAQTSRGSSPVR